MTGVYPVEGFSGSDIKTLSMGISKRADRFAVAVGDNYIGIRPLITGGIEMYDGVTGKSLTGFEKKSRNGEIDGNPVQPSRIYLNSECNEPHASGMPPQEFPNRMSEGLIDVAICAGYDIMVNNAGMRVHLNGEMNNPSTRTANMIEDLKEAGYLGVSLGVKPVAFPIIASRSPKYHRRINTLDDLRQTNVDAISEVSEVLRQYGKKKGIHFKNIRQAFGGADNQVASGLFPIGSDLLETGGNILKHARWVVPVVDEDGKMCIVTYSEPFLLVGEKPYKRDKPFFDDLFQFTKGCVEASRVNEPELFAERYVGFLQRFREKEAKLMEEGLIAEA